MNVVVGILQRNYYEFTSMLKNVKQQKNRFITPRTHWGVMTEEFDYGKLDPKTGMYENYPTEVKESFVNPLRYSYIHNTCNGITNMRKDIAETCASNPSYYTHMYCARCGGHYKIDEFHWTGTNITLGVIENKT